MQRRRDHIRAQPTYSGFHRPLRSRIHGRQLDSWRHRETPERRHRHRSSSPMRRHRSRSPVTSGSRDEYTHRSSYRDDQRNIPRTHSSHRSTPSDVLEANRSNRSAYFSPDAHSRHHSPPRKYSANSSLNKAPAHVSVSSAHSQTSDAEPDDPLAEYVLSTSVLPDIQPQTDTAHSIPTKPVITHSVSKPTNVYTCTSCKRTLTSASGWYEHRRFYHGLQTPRHIQHVRHPVPSSAIPDAGSSVAAGTEAIPLILASPMKKIPINVAPLKPMPTTRRRKPKAAITQPTIPTSPVNDLVDTGRSNHQSTQTTLLTVDFADAIPVQHLYDGMAADWLNSGFASAPGTFTDIASLLREHAKEGAGAMASILLKDVQSWINIISGKLGQP
jgi:hypothetical protein